MGCAQAKDLQMFFREPISFESDLNINDYRTILASLFIRQGTTQYSK